MKYLENGLRNWLNRRQLDREEMAQRIDVLNNQAKKEFKIPIVVAHIMMNRFRLQAHTARVQGAESPVNISYVVDSEINGGNMKALKKPYFISTAVEQQEGDFLDLPSERYTTHRVKRYGIYSIALTEMGEFYANSQMRHLVRLGTTAVIRGYEDLLAAAEDHIKRDNVRWF